MRRFNLVRNEDISGVSGTGVVAEGVFFERSGFYVLSWISAHKCVNIYPSLAEMMAVHGHEGATEILWIDVEEPLPTPVAEVPPPEAPVPKKPAAKRKRKPSTKKAE